MRLLRAQTPWWLLALVQQVWGLSLLEALASYPELSTLYSRVNATPDLLSLLGGANDFTFFAPTNLAIESFLQNQPNSTQNATFEALVQYSLVKGGFPSISFTTEPQFVPTNLNDTKYANVTGGQVVELVENDSQPQVVSGNLNVSSLTTMDIVCGGGIIHIVDHAFTLPEETVNAITSAHLAYFVSILTRGGYLSSTTNQYVHDIIDSTDVTYFIPNSEEALSNFSAMATTWSEDDLKKNFQYHVVPKRIEYSNGLLNGTTLVTAEGSNVTINTLGGDTYVNGAKITSMDRLVSNGVIHVIDNLLDRFNTAPPSMPTSASNKTLATSTSAITPAQTSPSSLPTTAGTLVNQPAHSHSNDLPLKIGLGAGLGGAAILSLIAIFLFLCLRRRKSHRLPPPPPPPPIIDRDSGNWDGHSMSTAPSDPKRYFVNNGNVQMRESTGPTGMVLVTNLEQQESAGAQGYYSEKEPIVPPRSPGRVRVGRERITTL